VRTPEISYLALGSNLGDLVGQLVKARAAIDAIFGVTVVRASSLYQSPAWGSAAPQPDYINAVISVRTTLSAQDLWLATAHIEADFGRIRNGARNAARTLDIDLLLYGDVVIHTADLTLPHPRMHERDFVLMPLLEIAPDVAIIGRGSASDCLRKIAPTSIQKLGHNSAWN
jgi:2-amino-4-hydroxy-6-hydroxymethyldihydropteridine diphosphokinase